MGGCFSIEKGFFFFWVRFGFPLEECLYVAEGFSALGNARLGN